MIAISEPPILLAHWYWRCAERKLYSGRIGDAVLDFKRVLGDLERAKITSQDECTRCCIQKQIEFHQRRISLLTLYNSPVETDEDSLLSEEGIASSQVFEDIVEVSIEKQKKSKTDLIVSEVEGETILLLTGQELETVSDMVEIGQHLIDPSSGVTVADKSIEGCLSEKEKIEAFVARIAELESENKALKESLRMEKSENSFLMESIRELK